MEHVFPRINIRCVPREMLKIKGYALDLQQFPRNPGNAYAWKNMFDPYIQNHTGASDMFLCIAVMDGFSFKIISCEEVKCICCNLVQVYLL